MARWEYLTVEIDSFGIDGKHYAAHYINGAELRDWKKTPLHDFINRLGVDGWEMTGTIILYRTSLFFKRSRP
jgi:hypothetical protein